MTSYIVEPPFDSFIEQQITAGRFDNGKEVVNEALKFYQIYQDKLQWLRNKVAQSIERGGQNTPEQVEAYLEKIAGE